MRNPHRGAEVSRGHIELIRRETDPDLAEAVLDGLRANQFVDILVSVDQVRSILATLPPALRARADSLMSRLERRETAVLERFLRLEP